MSHLGTHALINALERAVLAAPMAQLPALLVPISARLAEPGEVPTVTARPEEALLKADEVTTRLRDTPSFVFELVQRGEIEYQPFKRYKRFIPEAVEYHLANERRRLWGDRAWLTAQIDKRRKTISWRQQPPASGLPGAVRADLAQVLGFSTGERHVRCL